MSKKISVNKNQGLNELEFKPNELVALIGESSLNNIKLIMLNPTSITARSEKHGPGINASINRQEQIPEKYSIHYAGEAYLFQQPRTGKQMSLIPNWQYFRNNEFIGYDFNIQEAIAGEENIKTALQKQGNNLNYYSGFIKGEKIFGLPSQKKPTGLLSKLQFFRK